MVVPNSKSSTKLTKKIPDISTIVSRDSRAERLLTDKFFDNLFTFAVQHYVFEENFMLGLLFRLFVTFDFGLLFSSLIFRVFLVSSI